VSTGKEGSGCSEIRLDLKMGDTAEEEISLDEGKGLDTSTGV